MTDGDAMAGAMGTLLNKNMNLSRGTKKKDLSEISMSDLKSDMFI